MLKRLVWAFLFVGLSVVAVHAQTEATATTSAANVTTPSNDEQTNSVSATSSDATTGDATENTASSSSVSVSDNGNVSMDFREVDIKNVLKILSFKSGVNIVAGPEVVGTVTIQLKEVPWKHALEVILQTYGYAYEQKGNIIIVTTVDNLKKHREDALLLADQEPVETKTFTLNFSKASDVVASIEKMKSERGSIEFDQRTNTLIVTDIPKKLELMEEVIKTLDSTTPQVLIEAKIIETKLDNTENLGIDWTTKATATGAKSPTTFPFENNTVGKYIGSVFPAAASTDFTYGTLNLSQLSMVLELLRTRTDTNILSSPRIVTSDNKSARIVIGNQYPIPNYAYNEQQAKLQVNGFEYKDIGIIFDVTPHVNKAGFVTIDVEPKITEITGTATVENTDLPQLSVESAKTSVMIKSAETLVIAGLIKEKTEDTKKKTPIFGDIPGLGSLFQKSNKTKTKTDIMIFITPHIITPEVPPSN